MWTDGQGLFYEGDCRGGDRAATATEVAAYRAAINRAPVELPMSCEDLLAILKRKKLVADSDITAHRAEKK